MFALNKKILKPKYRQILCDFLPESYRIIEDFPL